MSGLDEVPLKIVPIDGIIRSVFKRLGVRFGEWGDLVVGFQSSLTPDRDLELRFCARSCAYFGLQKLADAIASEDNFDADVLAIRSASLRLGSRTPRLGTLEVMLRGFAAFCGESTHVSAGKLALYGDQMIAGFREGKELTLALLCPAPSASLDTLAWALIDLIPREAWCCSTRACAINSICKKPHSSVELRDRFGMPPADVAKNDELVAAYVREGLDEDALAALAAMESSRGGASCRS